MRTMAAKMNAKNAIPIIGTASQSGGERRKSQEKRKTVRPMPKMTQRAAPSNCNAFLIRWRLIKVSGDFDSNAQLAHAQRHCGDGEWATKHGVMLYTLGASC